MQLIGDIITFIFDVFLFPFKTIPSFWGLLFISVISGIWMILIFKAVSNQDKISRIRKKMGGQVLGILLHVNNPGTVFKFAWKLILSNFYYLWLILMPMLVIALPFILTYAQLEARYSTIPFAEATKPVTITLRYSGSMPLRDDFHAEGSNLTVLDPVIMIDTLKEVSFDILPESDADICLYSVSLSDINFPIGRIREGNEAIVSRGFDRNQFWNHLLKPWVVSPEISNAGPASGYFALPAIRFSIFGWYWSWLAVFLVFSSFSAFGGAVVFKIKV